MDRSRAHLALLTHLPARDWRRLGLGRVCRYCGQRYPCPPRRVALDHLADVRRDTGQRAGARPP